METINKERVFQKYLPLIEEAIQKQQLPDQPGGIYDAFKYAITLGGKRVRPVLVLMACECFGENMRKALEPALAIELFHNFTLIHDDIMDHAPIRRGKSTVYKKFGHNTAILTGDIMFTHAYKLLEGLDGTVFKKVFSTFNQVAVEVCEGQQYDMNFETEVLVSIADYLKMIELKTAVLLGASLKIGALTGGAGDADAGHLYNFGRNIGIAFQLQDDLLDSFGDQAVFGKKIGGDILQNKKTYLLLKAMELAEGGTKVELMKWLQLKEPDNEDKIASVLKIYSELGVKELAKSEKEKFMQAAYDHLAEIKIPDERKEPLKLFSQQLLNRTK